MERLIDIIQEIRRELEQRPALWMNTADFERQGAMLQEILPGIEISQSPYVDPGRAYLVYIPPIVLEGYEFEPTPPPEISTAPPLSS